MNVRAPKHMIVMLTPCVPTLKDLICVAVLKSSKETGKLAEVECLFFSYMIKLYFVFFAHKKVEQARGTRGCSLCLLVFVFVFLLVQFKTNKQGKQLVMHRR